MAVTAFLISYQLDQYARQGMYFDSNTMTFTMSPQPQFHARTISEVKLEDTPIKMKEVPFDSDEIPYGDHKIGYCMNNTRPDQEPLGQSGNPLVLKRGAEKAEVTFCIVSAEQSEQLVYVIAEPIRVVFNQYWQGNGLTVSIDKQALIMPAFRPVADDLAASKAYAETITVTISAGNDAKLGMHLIGVSFMMAASANSSSYEVNEPGVYVLVVD